MEAVGALGVRNPIVLIDGPSGAGKSTLADALASAWPADASPQLVRLDDLYPGWGGLAAGSHLVATELLGPLRATGAGRWRSWNWAAEHPADWHEVGADRPLIVEGCGALSQASARHADLRIWLTADDAVRKRRALARDRGAFDAHWDMWDAQFAEFVRTQHPLALADLVLRV
ncbi:ATP-binding protein [Gryllotalpicola protaetiae]|uniref:ATP-binding protein n=1 Tax=Gryllotalpicola protaetiae TaxID=2419771 RepID=A0A387BVL9_9MICO|nr:ATP-binding protein [Gryllotalpicola protaetiae]